MAFTKSLIALLPLFNLFLQSSAIAIVADSICPIPYIVPRAFSYFSDPTDEFLDEDDLPITVKLASPSAGHPQWISSMLLRTRPNIWTLEPYCMRSLEARQDICVYTSTWFAQGRGISFVAIPSEGPLVATAPVLKNQMTHQFDTWVNPENDQRIERVPIPNKGLGTLSRHHFERGDAAQSFTPVLCIQDGVMQMKLGSYEQNTTLNRGAANLPPKSRTLMLELHGQFGGNPVYDKVNTNAFNAAIGSSQQAYWSVYPETARYNHDCRPNTMYSIDERDLLHNLRVGRKIIPGEEITLSYLAPNMMSEERKQRIHAQWGFSCSCPSCTAPKDVKELSDYRIGMIETLETELNDLSLDRNASISTAEMLISLHQQERLDGVVGDAYMYAAFEHAYIGDKRGTQMNAALACEHMAIWRGTNHQYYQAMQRLLVNPEAERSWQYFARVKRGEVLPLG
ncbi:hypothetical protein BT63DRAFT_250514 [Microthyrium microscopicum]|uniref:SET domain-containing protein n=1 Tax=Microthyrium microscopicum TaxID=703497 RepID=A0A6A6UBY0_9PEZI|nr:hypothetical protein BT63DRAFT_250514 [Microthyrium microscopicum]